VHQRIVFADSVAAGRLARETAPDSAAAAKSPRWWTNCCGGRHDREAATEQQAHGKRVGIGARPPANPHAEAWIRQGDADALGKGDLYTARLTLDITPAMRRASRCRPSRKA
jgi:hypothetical protein